MKDTVKIIGTARRGYIVLVVNEFAEELCSIALTEFELYDLYEQLKNKFEKGGE